MSLKAGAVAESVGQRGPADGHARNDFLVTSGDREYEWARMSPTRRDHQDPPPRPPRRSALQPSEGVAAQTLAAPSADPLALELANAALDAARGRRVLCRRAGRPLSPAEHPTRERKVTGVSDNESYGLGVRALVDGCWGFAATSR